MKPSHWFTIAAALAGCAVAAGLYVVSGDGKSAAGPETAGVAKPLPHKSQRRSAGASAMAGESRSNRSAARAAAPGALSEPLRVSGRPPQGTQAVVGEAEWFARAAKVEQEANHEVRRLAEALNLSPEQQAGIFGVVARSSDFWLPGMQVGGGASTGNLDQTEAALSDADQVMAYLDADQQQTLIQDEMDRQAWWEEVLPQLLPPEFPAATDPGTTLPVDETKPFEGPDTLVE